MEKISPCIPQRDNLSLLESNQTFCLRSVHRTPREATLGLPPLSPNTICVNTCQSANPILWASGRCGQDLHGSSPISNKMPEINGQ